MRPDGILTGVRTRDLWVVGSTWMRFALRSGGGVVSLFLILIGGLFLSNFLIGSIEERIRIYEINASAETGKKVEIPPDVKEEILISSTDGLLSFVLADEPAGKDGQKVPWEKQKDFLTEERPVVFSGVLLLLMYLVPFTACLIGFNQTAGDIGNRGLRFLLSRTERPNIFIGRFLSATVFMVGALFVLVAVTVAFLALRFPSFGLANFVGAGLEGWWSLCMLTLPFIALCALMSSTQRSPFASLALCYAVAVLPWWVFKMVVGIVSGFDQDIAWLNFLTPWHWRVDLVSDDMAVRVTAHLVMIGFTVVFLLLGLMNFRKRDL